MPHIIEGQLSANGLNIAVVVSRFNSMISDRLLDGALDAINRNGGDTTGTVVVKVPGSFEIPLTAKSLAATKKYDAVVCLGAVIRGATSHYDHVASEVSKGVAQASLETGVPVLFGVITADNLEQAIERAGTKQGNKGFEATISAIEMANVLRKINE